MVRTYKRKKPPPSYSIEDMKNAINAVKTNQLTIYRAAQVYKIPKPTLYKHVHGQRGKSSTGGRPTALPIDQEKKIAECVTTMKKWGFGLSKKEIIQLGRFVSINKIQTPFRDGQPGDDWLQRFKTKYGLSLKKPELVEFARKKGIDPFIISDYFELLKKTIINIPPDRIFNIDESGFCLDPSRIKVVGAKGLPSHRVTSGTGKENITVLMGANAVGEKLPPLIVFSGKNLWDSWLPQMNEYPNTTYAATKNGWMEAETFEKYFTNSFLESIPKERPVVLIFDGHASHLSITVIKEALKNDVILLKLPPHSSHKLQPMDLSVFRSLKLKYDAELIQWQRTHYGCKLSKSMFAEIISKIWSALDPNVISSGFRKAGIFPYDDSVISKESYEPQQYERYLKSKSKNLEPRNETSVLDAAVHLPPSSPPIEINTTASSSPDNTFENLLLEKLHQTPIVKSARKKLCNGAEVITSVTALAMKKKKEDDKKTNVKKRGRPRASEERSDDERIDEEKIDDPDLGLNTPTDQVEEENEDENFNRAITDTEVEKDDWLLIKFDTQRKCNWRYIGQVVETGEEIFVKFVRRNPNSSTFYWPNIDDTSVVQQDEIEKCLPAPHIDKRGRITFAIEFDLNVV